MTDFQKRLQVFVSEFETAGNKVCFSQEVSQLDVDVLMGKLRKMYDFLLSTDLSKTESTIIETKVAENVCKQQPIVEQPKVVETKIKVEQPQIKANKTVIEKVVEKEPEVVIEQPIIKEEVVIVHIEEPAVAVEEPIVVQSVVSEQNVAQFVQEPIVEQQTQEVEHIVIQVEQEPLETETPKSSQSSVLSYLHNNIMKESEEKPKVVNSTLDLFSEKPTSIAERFENRNRSDLRTAIGVSEKFLFINDLFSGNLKEYTDFINKLNDITTWDMSKLVIEEMKQTKKWVSSSLAYSTLEDLIHKRFMK